MKFSLNRGADVDCGYDVDYHNGYRIMMRLQRPSRRPKSQLLELR